MHRSPRLGLRSASRWALAVILAGALPLAARTTRRQPASAPLTLRQIMSFAFPSELTASAHGERVAWVFDIEGVRNVWVADGPDFQARQVTHYSEDDGREIDSLRLTPDGKTAVYSRGSETNRQGQVADPNSEVWKPAQEVWAVRLEGPSAGQPRQLGTMECGEEDCEDIELSPDGRYAAWAARGQIWIAPVSGAEPARPMAYVRGDNDSPRWSPDGREIAFASHRGDHGFIGIYDFGAQTIRYLSPSVDRDSLPRWSPDGRQIAYVREPGIERGLPIIPWRTEHWSIWIADAATGQAHAIFASGDRPEDTYPSWQFMPSDFMFAPGRVLFPSWRDGHLHIYSLPPTGGEPALLTPGDFDVKDTALSSDGQTLLYSSNQNDIDRRHIWSVPVGGGSSPTALTQGDTIEWTPVQTGDGRYTLCLGSSGTVPAMPYLIAAGGRRMLASQLLADYPSDRLVTPKQVIFASPDGLYQLHGQLFVPRGRTRPGPALVYMHGGSMRQMMLGFHPMDYYHYGYAENQYLVSQGYVVLSVNYRTGIMYGFHFRYPDHAGWKGASEYQDIVAAGKYLQSLPIVDPHKIGLWGGSYGGFLTAMGLAKNSDIFAAGVDMHGVHDWRTERGGAGFAAPPDAAAAAKLAWESSPDAYVATWRSPVLLIQGDDDRNVQFSQMVDLVQRLRAQHVPFEQMVFPDEIHGFLMWRTWMRAYTATADFFDRVLEQGQIVATTH